MAWKKILTHPHTQDWTGDPSGGLEDAVRDGINRDTKDRSGQIKGGSDIWEQAREKGR